MSSRRLLRLAQDDERLSINGFWVRFYMLPSTARRLQLYLSHPVRYRRMTVFDETDYLSLQIEPQHRNAIGFLDGDALDQLMQQLLIEAGIPGEVAVTVVMNVRRADGGEVGGVSSLRQRYDSVGDVTISDYFQRLQESGYEGFGLRDASFQCTFQLTELLPLLVRGGCRLLCEGGPLSTLPDDHRTLHPAVGSLPLFDYASWPHHAKTQFYNSDTPIPKTCMDLRGVFYYGWNNEWIHPMCGWMSLLYVVTHFEYRVVCDMIQRDSSHTIDRLGPTSDMALKRTELYDRLMDYQSQPDSLYMGALRLCEQYEMPTDTPPSLGQLCGVGQRMAPGGTLAVYDASQRPLYILERKETSFCPRIVRCPMPPFSPRSGHMLTECIVKEYLDVQIPLFYDHTHAHFYPIFDLRSFFRRSSQGESESHFQERVREAIASLNLWEDDGGLIESAPGILERYPDVVEVVENRELDVASDRGDAVSGTKRSRRGDAIYTNYRLPCPCCGIHLFRRQYETHQCRSLHCPCCDKAFLKVTESEAHMSYAMSREGVPLEELRCDVCGRQCFNGACFKDHTRLCLGLGSTKCTYCNKSIAFNETQHVCQRYFCFNCQDTVADGSKLNPITQRFFTGLHACSLHPVKDISHTCLDVLKEVSRYRAFTFDFEAMLTPLPDLVYPFELLGRATDGSDGVCRIGTLDTSSPGNAVYVHTINCASLCELNVRELVECVLEGDSMFDDIRTVGMTDVDCARLSKQHKDAFHYWRAIEQRDVLDKTVTVRSLSAFWRRVVELSTEQFNYWYAHNMRAYDGRLLYDFLVTRGIYPINMSWIGQKVMHLEYAHVNKRRIIFRDSACHVATSLARLPSMFGLDSSMVAKGMFPYRFNRLGLQSYRGRVPDVRWFDTHQMDDRQYTEFCSWYKEVRAACDAFRDRYLDSAVHDGEDELEWWLRDETQSVMSVVWEQLDDTQKPVLKSGIYDVAYEMERYCENDVFVLARSLEAYVKVCCKYSGLSPLRFMTIPQFTYFMYRALFMPDNTLYFLDKNESVFARRALRGGNTNVRRLYYESKDPLNEGGRYVDVQSLYPTVQFYDPLPVGRPKITYFCSYDGRSRFTPQPSLRFLMTFFGFIECDLRCDPDRVPFHPPILSRSSIQRRSTLLGHVHNHRRIVLTSVELQAALRSGYVCTNVYRIDEYRQSRVLFSKFIRTWLRLKIVNSPCPVDKHDTIAFAAYSDDCQQRYAFDDPLTPDDFVDPPNIALRGLAKLVLNSLWGKFGQRPDLTQTQLLRTGYDVYHYELRRARGLIREKSRSHLRFNERVVQPIQLAKFTGVFQRETKNVAVASFVTAHARLRLWAALEKCGEDVLYHDTDSVIYVCRRNVDTGALQLAVNEGKFLGDWESETGDRLIHSFVSLAPKTYAYRYYKTDDDVSNGVVEEVVKGKGCKMHRENKAWIHFDGYALLLCCQFLRSTNPAIRSAFIDFANNQPTLRDMVERLVDKMDYILLTPPEQCMLLKTQWTAKTDVLDCSTLVTCYETDFQRPWRDVMEEYILRHLHLPSRVLLFRRLDQLGETVSFQLHKGFCFDYIKGEIDVHTLKTFPYGSYHLQHRFFADWMSLMVVFYNGQLSLLSQLHTDLSSSQRVVSGVGGVINLEEREREKRVPAMVSLQRSFVLEEGGHVNHDDGVFVPFEDLEHYGIRVTVDDSVDVLGDEPAD
jgi:hypothetical protein